MAPAPDRQRQAQVETVHERPAGQLATRAVTTLAALAALARAYGSRPGPPAPDLAFQRAADRGATTRHRRTPRHRRPG